MRLHRLRAEAFGPFATRVDVDFDELSEAGLFLLSGATGAGKTSVLDAVCFALYGDVPGDRSTAKRLRSDQAAEGAAPLVELETSIGDRRFRFVRSPAWDRPKKRGVGTTTEQAKVTVSELVGTTWMPLTSRLDEAGDLVARVLGLTQTQFTQVAMLPQGRFQAFLRARSDDRHRLLQQLFRTGRFEAVERWLVEHRKGLSASDLRARERVADLVSRATEAARDPLPADVDPTDLGLALDDGALQRWVEHARSAADADAASTRASLVDAEEAEAHARTTLETQRAEAARLERLSRARADLATLEAQSDEHDAVRRRVDAGRRAATVVPWLRLAQAADARASTTAARAAESAASLQRHVPDLDPEADLVTAGTTAAREAAEARAVRPRAQRLADLVAAADALDGRRDHLAREIAQVQRAHTARPVQLEELRAQVLEVRHEADLVDSLTALAQDARTRLDAHAEVADLTARHAAARHSWLDARTSTVACKDALADLQLARVEGMAAELAGSLVVGGCCPVCGSADHPSLARPAPGSPDAAAEKAARKDLGDAEVVEHALDLQVRELDRSLAAATARAGTVPAAELLTQLADHQAGLADAHRAAGRLPDLESRLTAGQAELDELDERLASLLSAAAVADAERRAADAEVESVRGELVAIGADDLASLDALAVAHQRTADLCADAARTAADADEATWSATQAHRALTDAALEAGFDDSDLAVESVLDPAHLERLGESATRYEQQLATARAILRDAPAVDGPTPDVAAATNAHAAALALLRSTAADADRESARAERLHVLSAELTSAIADWVPVRRDLDVASRLASFCEGKSPDNLLRMRLSAFVLAYRLGQVVDAANERLARMSDQRYSLEHTGRRGAGETRGGLSLLVRDDWSGESRDPATLSGGETFVVSLALALGLADVIAHETGGASLATLFVDEGFGSLDADTLDDVMDTLDALRDGGRVVGVVSHVAEMRDRIPTQLVVTKSRRGSTVSLRR